MGLAPLGYEVWTRHLRHSPLDPSWPDRDRFVLSAGHGCMLLYALLGATYAFVRETKTWIASTGHPDGLERRTAERRPPAGSGVDGEA